MFNPPITGDMPLDSYLYDLHLALEANSTALNSSVIPPDLAAGDPGSYVYRYIAVKYADDNVGTNLSNSPTNKTFFGIFNSGTIIESTNPADYTWYEAAVPFGLSRSLYYLILGGRQIKFAVALTAPDYHWKPDDGSSIDLDILVPDSTVSGNQIIDNAITTNKLNAGAVTADKIDAGAITADKIFAGAVTADKISAGAVTADKIGANAVTAVKINAGAVTADKISVSSLSAVNTETGNLTVGASGSIKGGQTGFNTGNGFFLGYSGAAYKFSVGSGSQSLTWDGSSMSITGNIYGVGAARFTGVNSVGSISAVDANSGYAATIGVYGRGAGYAGRGIVGTCDGGTGSIGVIGVSGGGASESGVTAVGSGGSAALRVQGGPITIDNTSLVNNLNVQYLNGQEASAFVNVAGGTTNGKYFYYVNNNTAPSNPSTMAAWIKVSTNDGATVWFPGYF
jgi:hypothetical protein